MRDSELNEVQEELLGLLQEEMAEVIQCASKIRRTGFKFCKNGGTETTLTHFQKEVIDAMLVLDMLTESGFGEFDFDVEAYINQKVEKLKVWTNLPHDLIESI